MDIPNLSESLIQWGPAAAAVILIFFAERKLRLKWNESKGSDRKICSWLYTGNWILVSTLLIIVSIIWVMDRGKLKITMSGVVRDLHYPYMVNNPSAELFTKKKGKTSFPGSYYVEWHYTKKEVLTPLEIRIENQDKITLVSVTTGYL